MQSITSLKCEQCGAEFTRRTAEVKASTKRGRKIYCGHRCSQEARATKPLVRGTCQHCGTEFERRAGHLEKVLFCSRECVGLFRNAEEAQRRRVNSATCERCGAAKSWSGTVCRQCLRDEKRGVIGGRTLAELRAECSTVLAFHAKIRGLARSAYQGPASCNACGYSLHVEVCHVRPVGDFPDSATLAEVNDPANLAALDRRCHWELDNGYLRFDGENWLSVTPAALQPA